MKKSFKTLVIILLTGSCSLWAQTGTITITPDTLEPALKLGRNVNKATIKGTAGSTNGTVIIDAESSSNSVILNKYVSANTILSPGGGNVGVGIASPSKTLTIKRDGELGWDYNGTGSSSYHTISGGGINPMTFKVNSFSANTPVFDFIGVSDTILTMYNGGNVGIGTITPDYKLDVNGDTYTSNLILPESGQLKFYPQDTMIYDSQTLPHYSLGWYDDSWENDGPTLWQSGWGGMKFFTQGESRLAITHNGNVGIGTDSTNAKLDVLGENILIGADNETWSARTNQTSKSGFVTLPSSDNFEEPVQVIWGKSSTSNETDSAYNHVYVGGGSSRYNTANKISLFTSANNTTVEGTERMRISEDGTVHIFNNLTFGSDADNPACTFDGTANSSNSFASEGGQGVLITNFNEPLSTGLYWGDEDDILIGGVPDGEGALNYLLNMQIPGSTMGRSSQLQIGSKEDGSDRLFFRTSVNIDTVAPANVTWNEVATKGVNSFSGNQTINGDTYTSNLILPESGQLKFYPQDTMIYDSLTLGHYSLGWYDDSWENDGPTLWQSGWGGMKFFTQGQVRLAITHNGNIGIGTDSTNYKLDVNGTIRANEILVTTNSGADFVFEENYNLKPIDEVHTFVKENKHLPEVPSAAEMIENGVNITDMQIKLLQKIEELTLYLAEQDQIIKSQQIKIDKLEELIVK